MDYLVVKPYSQHPFSKTTKYENIRYSKYLYLADKLSVLNTDKFNVIFRINTMRKWDAGAPGYKHCYALRFGPILTLLAVYGLAAPICQTAF